MRERVARAIYDGIRCTRVSDEHWRKVWPDSIVAQECERAANSAIAAMREPTREMVIDSIMMVTTVPPQHTSRTKQTWMAMIDSALKE